MGRFYSLGNSYALGELEPKVCKIFVASARIELKALNPLF